MVNRNQIKMHMGQVHKLSQIVLKYLRLYIIMVVIYRYLEKKITEF